MSEYTPKSGDVAEYTFGGEFGDEAGTTAVGDVVSVGKTYADVKWREAHVERIRFREPGGVTFKAAES